MEKFKFFDANLFKFGITPQTRYFGHKNHKVELHYHSNKTHFMKLKDIFTDISEKLYASSTVKTVYGEPIEAHGKTIVPVAEVRYGFGAGGGKGGKQKEADETYHEGAGGGGGVTVTPIGVLEITAEETRYIPIQNWKK